MAYKYIVTHTATGEDRLVEASSPAHAVAFCAKDAFSVERISDKAASLTGLTLQKASPEKVEAAGDPPAETRPETAPPAASKRKPAAPLGDAI